MRINYSTFQTRNKVGQWLGIRSVWPRQCCHRYQREVGVSLTHLAIVQLNWFPFVPPRQGLEFVLSRYCIWAERTGRIRPGQVRNVSRRTEPSDKVCCQKEASKMENWLALLVLKWIIILQCNWEPFMYNNRSYIVEIIMDYQQNSYPGSNSVLHNRRKLSVICIYSL